MWKYLNIAAIILLVIGGLNWGLVGFFDLNLVTFLFGDTMATQAVYGLVALAAIYKIFCLACCCGCSCNCSHCSSCSNKDRCSK